MTPEEVWRGKTDAQLVEASRMLSDFTEDGQRAILAELARREAAGLEINRAVEASEHFDHVKNPVTRLWRGYVRLPITYWVWGVLVSLLLTAVTALVPLTGIPALSLVLQPIWAHLARIAVAVGVARAGVAALFGA